MKTIALLLLGVSIVISGCGVAVSSDPYASPGMSERTVCESGGGYWNRTANVCEATPLR